MEPIVNNIDEKEEELDRIDELSDWNLPIAFNEKRHIEKIEGGDSITQTWRMKERMKTVSVALVVCLNVGVDPPDVVKTQPCARLECWIDPLSMGSSRALEAIGNALQKQYERWQPRARYKQSLDPTVDEVKKLCTSLRRNAKEERVLFHYNGHGVPKPTTNGEIWVFNRIYTQYIPLSVYDLQAWMGAPSIYVYDCSNAGVIVTLFKKFADQHDKEYQASMAGTSGGRSGSPPTYKHCIQLAACAEDEILPMHPDLPADVFTSCLTTPIRIALRWHVLQNSSRLIPGIDLDLIDRIPGQLSDRRTMLGELNWIFTAITDTIAWNTLPRELFQKLFRQDLLVASLFRNFLLAERVMHSYSCTPISEPKLPSTHLHPLWAAWDLALDQSLAGLPAVLESEDNFHHSSFFQDQLTAFQVSLSRPPSAAPPAQLPIVLQVLLSQVHRLRALDLLARYLDLGPAAVNMALSVGIFPYVLKLLQSSAKELRPLLVFIWAKILAVDSTCQADLVRDNGHRYFISILQDSTMSWDDRGLAAFVLGCMVDEGREGQEAALQASLLSTCLEALESASVPAAAPLRRWLAICLGRLWRRFDEAFWNGVRCSAHDKLYILLKDPVPEVRAAAVFALGTYMSAVSERSGHANSIDQGVAMTLLSTVAKDMSPLVRQELVVALQGMVVVFENSFLSVALHEMRDGKQVQLASGVLHSPVSTIRRNTSRERLVRSPPSSGLDVVDCSTGLRSFPSSSSISSLGSSSALPTIQIGSVYHKMWAGLTALELDPFPAVASMARCITDHIRQQLCAWPGQTSPHRDYSWTVPLASSHLSAKESALIREHGEAKSSSLPPSPSNRPPFILGESPPKISLKANSNSTEWLKRKNVIKTISEDSPEENNNGGSGSEGMDWLVETQLVEWSCKELAEPLMAETIGGGDASKLAQQQWRFRRNRALRKEATVEVRQYGATPRLDTILFSTRLQAPQCLLLHPYDSLLAVAYKDSFVVWDYLSMSKAWSGPPAKGAGRSTALTWMNAHDVSLVGVAADDGAVRVYRSSGDRATLVTAWQAISPPAPPTHPRPLLSHNSVGTVMAWDEVQLELVVGGEGRSVRVWDAASELNTAEIPIGDHAVTCLSVDSTKGETIAVGCADGTVKLVDRRAGVARLPKYWDHTGRVVGVSLDESSHRLLSVSTGGDVRLYDTRRAVSALVAQLPDGVRAFATHPAASLFASGCANQVSIYSVGPGCQASLVNTIKSVSNEWFSNTKFGPISCLAFHPYRLLLAAASSDNSVYIYSVDPKR